MSTLCLMLCGSKTESEKLASPGIHFWRTLKIVLLQGLHDLTLTPYYIISKHSIG